MSAAARGAEPKGAAKVAEHREALRRSFDAAFAELPREAETGGELFLAIRAGGEPYAIRLRDIQGVFECRKVVALPCSPPGLAGITSIRGRLYGVHVLSSLLGRSPLGERPRWLLIAGGEEPIALSIESIEACIEVRQDDLVLTEGREFVREMVTRRGRGYGILMLEALVSLALRRVEGAEP